MIDGKACLRPGVKDTSRWQPVGHQTGESLRTKAIALTATSQRLWIIPTRRAKPVPPSWMRPVWPVSLWWARFRRDRVFARVFTYFPSSSQHFRCCGRTCPYPEPRRQQL